MKKLTSLTNEQVLELVLASDKLKEKFESYIIDVEFDYLEEKIRCFPQGTIRYSYGVYNNDNYLRIIENKEIDFLYGVEKSINDYGGTEKLTTLLKQCEKLRGTNLFNYHIRKLCGMFFQEEIMDTIKHLEDLSYKIYLQDSKNEFLIDWIDAFCESGLIDGVYVNNENKLCQMDYL
jgi:hypothetical protein